MDAVGAVDGLRRAGLMDPTRGAAAAAGFARWGPTLAAGVAAWALRTPGRIAVAADHGSLTWRDLDRRTTRIARGLRGRGMRRSDSLGLLCRNHVDFVVSVVAAAKAGLTAVLLNTGSSARELEAVLARERVDAVIADVDRRADLESTTFSGLVIGTTNLDGLERGGRHRVDVLVPAPAAPVLMTSGTTGTPKGARRGLRPSAAGAGLGIFSLVPYRADDVFVIPAPLFHAWGFANLGLAVALGARVVPVERYSPEAVVEAVADHGGTVVIAVPIMLRRLLDAFDLDLEPLRRLRIVACSGSALPAALATEWMDRVGDTLYNLYGSTEVGSATIATPGDLRAAPGTAGRAIPGCEVRVLDDAGRPVARGVAGRLFVAGGGAFDGYTGGGGKAVIDGAMATGDVGYLDDAGRLFVSGRADDMIVSGGENVFPGPVEAKILAMPGVIDAAVVGVVDDEFGQRLRANVVAERGSHLTPDAVRAVVRRELGRHYVPRDVVLVDSIPRNAAGKVIRAGLAGAGGE